MLHILVSPLHSDLEIFVYKGIFAAQLLQKKVHPESIQKEGRDQLS